MVSPRQDCILVLVSDSLERDLIVLTLERGDYDVVVCGSAGELGAMIGTHKPRVLLMDLHLPGSNSLETLRGLRRAGTLRGVVVIAVSALAFQEVVRQSMQAGVQDFLVKPVMPEILLARVRRAMGG